MKHRIEYDKKAMGAKLRGLRLKRELSVEDVRQYMYLGSVQSIYKWESGDSLPAVDNFLALLDLYEAKLEDVVVRCDENVFLYQKVWCVVERFAKLKKCDYVISV